MKYRYSKFTGDDLDDVDLEDLLSRLSDMLLSSGFESPYGLPYDDDDGPGHSMQSLHDAILEAILNGGMLSDETLEKMLGKDWQQAEDAEERLDDLIRRIIEKLQHQGYLTGSPESQAQANRKAAKVRAAARADPRAMSASRSPTRASTSSATARCGICSAQSARAASAATTRARWRPASRRAARPSRTSSATR